MKSIGNFKLPTSQSSTWFSRRLTVTVCLNQQACDSYCQLWQPQRLLSNSVSLKTTLFIMICPSHQFTRCCGIGKIRRNKTRSIGKEQMGIHGRILTKAAKCDNNQNLGISYSRLSSEFDTSRLLHSWMLGISHYWCCNCSRGSDGDNTKRNQLDV